MPRARNLKPGFFKDAKVVACSFEARLLFQGLWCMADYKGRLKYIPIEIKMEVFPADSVDVEKLMQELSDQGLIEIYHDHSGSTLVQVTNFSRHQNPHVNEKVGKDKKPLPCLPGPDECCEAKDDDSRTEDGEKQPLEQRVKDALVALREYSESDPADSLNLIPSYLFHKAGESTGDSKPAGAVGVKTFLETCKANTEQPIHPDDPIFEYTNDAGIPPEFVKLCWLEFVERNIASGKRQKDWRAAFRNCIRGNWYKLWWLDGEEYTLTTTGKQAEIKHRNTGRAA